MKDEFWVKQADPESGDCRHERRRGVECLNCGAVNLKSVFVRLDMLESRLRDLEVYGRGGNC